VNLLGRRIISLIHAIGLVLGCCAANPLWAGVSLTDDRGVRVNLPAPPQRIVSLLPSLTETVCELGACAQLVGVDRNANHPASVRDLPHVGGLDDVNVEAVVALRPDVVLLAGSSRATERLEALGLKVVALEPHTHEDVRRVAATLALLLGQADSGERLWRRLEAQVGAAAQSVPTQARGWQVYYEVDSAPYAAGEASFIGHLLRQLGLVNIVPAGLGPFPKLNPEFVVRADPQLIMVSERSAASLSSRPGWSGIRALRDRRVCAFTAAQGDVLSRPGPRLGEAAQVLAACLRKLALPQQGTAP
jgi:iron complex transport system substrate-binding protein